MVQAIRDYILGSGDVGVDALKRDCSETEELLFYKPDEIILVANYLKGHFGFCRRDESCPGYLLCEAVVIESRPVADVIGGDKVRGYNEIVENEAGSFFYSHIEGNYCVMAFFQNQN